MPGIAEPKLHDFGSRVRLPGKRFLHQFAERCVEEDSVEVFQGNRFPTGFEQVFGLPAIKLVALVQRAEVALDGQGAVDNGVLGTHVGLVEIVDMLK